MSLFDRLCPDRWPWIRAPLGEVFGPLAVNASVELWPWPRPLREVTEVRVSMHIRGKILCASSDCTWDLDNRCQDLIVSGITKAAGELVDPLLEEAAVFVSKGWHEHAEFIRRALADATGGAS